MRLAIALIVVLSASSGFAQTTAIPLSRQAAAKLAIVEQYNGAEDTTAWMQREVERLLNERVTEIRAQIMLRMKATYVDSLTDAQMIQYWKTQVLPTPYPTATARPTETPLPTATPSPAATSAPAVPTPTEKGGPKK